MTSLDPYPIQAVACFGFLLEQIEPCLSAFASSPLSSDTPYHFQAYICRLLPTVGMRVACL